MVKGISFRAKIAGISLSFSLPILALLFIVTERRKEISQADKKEILGAEYMKSILGFQIESQRIMMLSFLDLARGQQDFTKEVGMAKSQADRFLQDLETTHGLLQNELNLGEDSLNTKNIPHASPARIKDRWVKYLTSTDREAQFESFVKLSESVDALITAVANESALILDPQLDTYYVMDAMVFALPKLVKNQTNVLVKNASTMFSGKSDEKQRIHLAIHHEKLREAAQHLEVSLITAKQEDEGLHESYETLQRQIPIRLESLVSSLRDYQMKLESIPEKMDREAVKQWASLYDESQMLLLLSQSSLVGMIQKRIELAQSSLAKSIATAIGVWLVCGILSLLVQKKVSASLSMIATQLQKVTSQTLNSSEKLSESSQQSSQAANQEAAAIQESVAAMAEMTSMLSQTAQHTRKANQAAQDALEKAQSGADTMKNLSHSMGRIAEANVHLKEITSIIEGIASRTNVINDIVFKTQLLAVNASIEAARAGHHGKGFAVVANEVASLASMSGKAAEEIRDLLKQSRLQVSTIIENTKESIESGQSVTHEALSTFEAITHSMHDINDKVHQIFEATREQEIGVRQTSDAMGELNRATTSNAQHASHNADLADELRRQSVALRRIEHAMNFVLFGLVETHKPKIQDEWESLQITKPEPTHQPEKKVSNLSLVSTPSSPRAESKAPGVSSGSRKSELAQRILKKAGSPSLSTSSDRQSHTSPKPEASRFSWQDAYDIGVDAMNSDHKKLLKLMAQLEESHQRGASTSELRTALHELLDWTLTHFRQEEAYMESIQYPEFKNHQTIHQNLIERFQVFQKEFENEGKFSDSFFQFLQTWLTAHIQGVDIKYGQYAQEHASVA